MSDVDDLQSFIADCEWKTRKILRESNKRTKENARSLAAKGRVERLKHNGTIGASSLKTKSHTPLAKSKRLNISVPPAPRADVSTTKKATAAPVKDWKGRDKIIHDAYETIKSFPIEKKTLKALKENQQAEKAQVGIHSSLSASPFGTTKGRPENLAQSKHKPRGVIAELGLKADDTTGNDEPAMVTRRTIERDFYIMSKKRNNLPSKRRQPSKKSEPTPELKTSVLRKKYRCDERITKARRKKAERLYEKLKRLKIPNDEVDDMAGAIDGDEAGDSDSSASSDEEEYIHAIHDLVERHITDENNRSLKRSNKTLMSSVFKPDVKEFWAHLQQNTKGKDRTKTDGQVPSVPLHIATKKFDSIPREISCTGENNSQHTARVQWCPPDSHFFSPYKESNYVKRTLVINEPLTLPAIDGTIPLAVSIARESYYPHGREFSESHVWIYEIYDPCNGSTQTFTLSDEEFDSLNMDLKHSISHRPGRKAIEKVVYNETASYEGIDCTHVVLSSANEIGITHKLYRSDGHITDELHSMCTDENLIANLKACEVLQLLKKHHIYSAFDTEFWMNEYNHTTIWKPLIKMFQENSAASNDATSLLTAVTKAHNSFVSLRTNLNRATSNRAKNIFKLFQQQSSTKHGLSNEGDQEAPLSMKISGCSPYSNIICPGHISIGKRGVWRFSDNLVDENTDSMFPTWPSLVDIKYPGNLDASQASAYFCYKKLGPQKGHSVNVLTSMAFESPIIAPYCFATDKGYMSPPFSKHESLTGSIPYIHLDCTSLLENPVESRLDTLLPPPVIILDPGASEYDWKDAPRNADGQVYHCREFSEVDEDGFQVRTFASKVEYDDTILSTVYGISESAASPNRPTTSPFLTCKSSETCTLSSLSRKRTSADYHYIAESDRKGTMSEPYLFSTHMSAYKSIFVSRKSISSYREQEQFLYATKEAETKKIDLALKMKVAEEIVEERLKARIAKIEISVKGQVSYAENCDTSVAVELPSSAGETNLATKGERIPCDVDLFAPSYGHPDSEESEDLANLMLKNTNFLKALARKLGISEQQVMQIDSTPDNDIGMVFNTPQFSIPMKSNSDELQDEQSDSRGVKAADPALSHVSAVATAAMFEAKSIPTLKINCKRYRDIDRSSSRGDGWKRLPRSDTIVGDFSLTKRNVQRGSGVPKFKKLEDNRNFIAVNAVQELPYKTDSQQFVTEPKSFFVRDLTTERLRLAKTYRQQQKTKDSMLSMSQQQSLDEILQIPVSKKSEKSTEEMGAHLNSQGDECDEVVLEKESNPLDHVSRAVLAVKNHNLPDLEQVLDTEGLSVETRDQHGNTLFVLACQQGSKKLGKFLLRRGADINAQNNGGNAALHYLYEYKHISLAEYLIRKGADDSIKNGEGLTVYEGTQLN